MRKSNGRWRYVEYALCRHPYTILAQGQLCQNCHMPATRERLRLHRSGATAHEL